MNSSTANDYHFVTEWHIPGTTDEIITVLSDATALPQWWPSVYLTAKQLAPGDASGLGKRVELYTKGWLPYTLRWGFVVTDVQPGSFSLRATGDFDGTGTWYLTQHGDTAHVIYDWRIRADKPLLRTLSFVAKPFFAANHRWAMSKGEESLRLELARRRAQTATERARIPPPPPPTTSSWMPLILVSAVAVALFIEMMRAVTRRRAS